MYDLHDYARMIADQERMGPYVSALAATVRPGSVVVDVGAGIGILALVACRLGARRVFAIETNDGIEVGRELARENGCADRIVFVQKDAREAELPERADVLVSDLRGSLPLFDDHLAVIADARERFLKPGGCLIPALDRLMVAVVEDEGLHTGALGPAEGPLGVTLWAMQARLKNATLYKYDRILEPSHVVSTPACWARLEYASVRPSPITGRAELSIIRPCTGHGLLVWFEATLHGEHGFSNAPGHVNSYTPLFLPWPRPVPLVPRDLVEVELWAQAGGPPWGWNSSVNAATGIGHSFKQSSFLSSESRPVARPQRGSAQHGSQTVQG
jgi:protein arginine N-methyltransferase 1